LLFIGDADFFFFTGFVDNVADFKAAG